MAALNVVRELQSVFCGTADRLARQTGFVRRQSKLDGSCFAQTLTFGWLHNPDATLEELAQTASSLGVAISAQGLDQRFGRRAAVFLKRLLQEAVLRVVSTEPVAIPLLQRFAGVCLLDSTTITLPPAFARAWPGCGQKSNGPKAGIKAQVRLNLLDGTLRGPFLYPASTNDKKGRLHSERLPPGTLRLADLGFFSVASLRHMDRQGVYWLTRVQMETGLVDSQGHAWTLAAFLAKQTSDRIDVPIALGVEQRLPCRLLAVRVSADVAKKRRRELRKYLRRFGRLHPDRHYLAGWNFYATNLPPDKLSLEEACVLVRCRWQIELLFKLWKNEGHVDESRSGKPWRILCEIYAKLLGMVVQHWVLLTSCWSYPNRSLVKASRTVRTHAVSLASVLPHGHMVYAILATVQRCLKTGCRVNRRRRAPPTHQLLLDLPKAG
jgi:hypothetical protein